MRFTVASAAIALASALSVSAQTTHNITVGAGGAIAYNPPNITAAIGDIVTFTFMSGNHTVSQSTFATPCDQFTNTSISDPTKQNLTSGFMPVAANATSFPTWSIQITQSTPIWLYCAHVGHCAKGMVGAINANESSANTFEAYEAKAIATGATTTNSTGTNSTGTTGSPTGSPSATQSKGAAGRTVGSLNAQLGGGIGMALMGVALGLVL